MNRLRIRLWQFAIEHVNTFLAICFSFALLAIRIAWTESITYLFLCWNLFLAFVPYFAARALQDQKNGLKAYVLLTIWLVFLPNAPYILTDLFHLRPMSSLPLWFDLCLLLSFGFNSLVLGYHSLLIVHKWIRKNIGLWPARLLLLASFYLSAIGIYLGRYLRWNSWDVVTKPGHLIRDFVERMSSMHNLIDFVLMSAIFGTLLLSFYLFTAKKPLPQT